MKFGASTAWFTTLVPSRPARLSGSELEGEGLDYTEVFALVARIEIVRIVVVLAHSRGWNMWQLDVKSAFLNGLLEE